MAKDKVVVAVDFDDTITTNPRMWRKFMRIMRMNGFNVIIVTWRYEYEWPDDLKMFQDEFQIYHTGRQAKDNFMLSKGIKVNIWIDDNPSAILFDEQELIEYDRAQSIHYLHRDESSF